MPFAFLEPGVKYKARIYRDDPDCETITHVRIDEQAVDSETELPVTLQPNGGQAYWLTPSPVDSTCISNYGAIADNSSLLRSGEAFELSRSSQSFVHERNFPRTNISVAEIERLCKMER